MGGLRGGKKGVEQGHRGRQQRVVIRVAALQAVLRHLDAGGFRDRLGSR